MPNFPFIRHAAGAALAACALAGLSSCAYNEELGRSQLAIIPASQMSSLGATAWADVNKKEKVSTDPKYVSRLNRVAPKILRAAGENPRNWDYRVFDSKQLNAFALPGNHFAVYTGLMDLMANDDQLATVIGHEVGHVRANHGGERVSQQLGTNFALGAAQQAIGAGSQTGQAALGALGVGAQYGVLLPFSRKHELEADRLGVIYMNRAGYDPNEALKFWTKMSAAGGAKPPEFASTHPSDATRIEQIRDVIATLPPRGR
ncbi:MAG: M48 family metallopeptidase [Parvularculaceae bacterium]|nr:M48 family metallopeptidase [Parvularculaceae bacterium]